jgi:signal peptidase I
METMAEFWRRRRAKKIGKDWLRHARTSRQIREDIAPATEVGRLREAEAELGAAVKAGDVTRIENACASIEPRIRAIVPPRPFAGFRENLEVVVVAVAVAMAFRTYFLQPFKIPTGSMQPTLYGIHYTPRETTTVFDRLPLSLVRLALFGERSQEMTAKASGEFLGPMRDASGTVRDGMSVYLVGGVEHRIPKEATLLCQPGRAVVTGQRLALWTRTIGDHLFVNRVRWNVLSPTRGEVMVFKTRGIKLLDQKTHYIKRLVGLPGETISIDEPYLVVNGRRVDEPEAIRRIENREPGYEGYVMAGIGANFLAAPGHSVQLTGNEFFGMGDNTHNSFDSRYWGPVPAANMVGPAWIVYWPLSRRWGRIN